MFPCCARPPCNSRFWGPSFALPALPLRGERGASSPGPGPSALTTPFSLRRARRCLLPAGPRILSPLSIPHVLCRDPRGIPSPFSWTRPARVRPLRHRWSKSEPGDPRGPFSAPLSQGELPLPGCPPFMTGVLRAQRLTVLPHPAHLQGRRGRREPRNNSGQPPCPGGAWAGRTDPYGALVGVWGQTRPAAKLPTAYQSRCPQRWTRPCRPQRRWQASGHPYQERGSPQPHPTPGFVIGHTLLAICPATKTLRRGGSHAWLSCPTPEAPAPVGTQCVLLKNGRRLRWKSTSHSHGGLLFPSFEKSPLEKGGLTLSWFTGCGSRD